jgi:hypothetical protein
VLSNTWKLLVHRENNRIAGALFGHTRGFDRLPSSSWARSSLPARINKAVRAELRGRLSRSNTLYGKSLYIPAATVLCEDDMVDYVDCSTFAWVQAQHKAVVAIF